MMLGLARSKLGRTALLIQELYKSAQTLTLFTHRKSPRTGYIVSSKCPTLVNEHHLTGYIQKGPKIAELFIVVETPGHDTISCSSLNVAEVTGQVKPWPGSPLMVPE
jgi:hypothetical protein